MPTQSNIPSYIRAAIPEPYRVLGLQLLPFSLGHMLLMIRFDCAFASDTVVDGGINDLLLGCYICSRTYEQCIEELYSGEWENFCKHWGYEIRKYNNKQRVRKLFGMGHNKINLLEKFKLFNAYMRDGCKVPGYWNEEKATEESGAHWTHNLLSTLVSQCGYTESQALNMPLAKAFSEYFKFAESQGVVQLMTEEELAEAEK